MSRNACHHNAGKVEAAKAQLRKTQVEVFLTKAQWAARVHGQARAGARYVRGLFGEILVVVEIVGPWKIVLEPVPPRRTP